jgi:hypothetical protein
LKNGNYLSVLCIYSKNDKNLKEVFSEHFKSMVVKGLVDKAKYVIIEDYQSWHEIEELKMSTDVVLFLLSAYSLRADYTQSYAMDELLELHYQRYVAVFPILIRPCDYQNTIFDQDDLVMPSRRMVMLPEDNNGNYKPIKSSGWHSVDDGFLAVCEQLDPFLQGIRAANTKIGEAWKFASTMNTVRAYQDFLREQILNKYTEEARRRKDKLLEEQLWRTATLRPSMETLLDYYLNAPIGEHQRKVLQNMAQISKDHDIAWQDTQKNKDLAFLLDYKSRFAEGNYAALVEQMLDEVAAKPLEEQYQPSSLEEIQEQEVPINKTIYKTEGYYLTYRIYKELSAEEALAVELLTEYIERVDAKLSYVAQEIDGRIYRLQIALFTTLFSILLYLASQFYFEVATDTPSIVFRYILPFVVLGYVAYSLRIAIQVGEKESAFCKSEEEQLERKTVALKIAFLYRDHRNIRGAIIKLMQIEKTALTLLNRKVWNYIFPE